MMSNHGRTNPGGSHKGSEQPYSSMTLSGDKSKSSVPSSDSQDVQKKGSKPKPDRPRPVAPSPNRPGDKHVYDPRKATRPQEQQNSQDPRYNSEVAQPQQGKGRVFDHKKSSTSK